MLDFNEPFKQEVLHDNKEIFERLKLELGKAKTQILVVAAWFTDPDLLQILLDKAGEKLDVRVIIAENDDNTKLDFASISGKGAKVYRTKNEGYGTMHKKFCVIDKVLAIHGSYNWTVNARRNNHESVIVTNHPGTVAALIQDFNEMELRIGLPIKPRVDLRVKGFFQNIFNGKSIAVEDEDYAVNELPKEELASGKQEILEVEKPVPADFKAEYTRVLDGMIAAEVCNFDRGMLRQQGYERAEANNGDPQVLSNAMDSIYSVFINDIEVVDDKKKRLISKINEQKVVHSANLEHFHESQVRTIEADFESQKQEKTILISNLKSQIALSESEIETIKTHKIFEAEKELKGIELRIGEIEQEVVTPKFKHYEFWPVLIMNVCLVAYIVLFYSSAAYIFLFSGKDANLAHMNGTFYDPPQVFEPNALTNTISRGSYAVAFVGLFVFVPISIATMGRLTKGTRLNNIWTVLSLTIIVDTFLAYKVAASIHEASYLTGKTTELWKFTDAFTDLNFYLVFILGSLGLLLFKFFFDKFISLFEERNPDVKALQLKLEKSQQVMRLEKCQNGINILKEQIEGYRKEVIRIKNEVVIVETEIAGLPNKKSNSLEKNSIEYQNKKKMLEDTTAIYITHIENDILPISLDSMRDRVNVFLEGWNDFLHDEYSVAKAIDKSKQASDVVIMWQRDRLSNNRIDSRIKAL